MKVFVIGSGPQVEGRVTELAVRALMELGHHVVLLDPSPLSTVEAQRTYLEPLTLEVAQRIITAESPDAILAGFGRAPTQLALELRPSLGSIRWLGPAPELLAAAAPAEADTVVEMAGPTALGQLEQVGDTWLCPAPRPRAELIEAAAKELRRLSFNGCARVGFKNGKLTGVDPVVGAPSAFSSRALGISIPRLAVRLALGLPVDESPKPAGVAVRRVQGGEEVMTLPNEAAPRAPGRSVVVLGAAGVEGVIAAEGYEPIVVDSNPSNFTGTATRYYEPNELQAVLSICRKEQPYGVVVQLGAPAALALAPALEKAGVRVLGTSGTDLARATDRARFAQVLESTGLVQPPHGVAADWEQAVALASKLQYPLLVRGGPTLVYVADEAALRDAFVPGALLQAFVTEATQACVELLRDRTGKVIVAGVVEHVELAGVHAADAACTLPPHSLKPEVVEKLKDAAVALAHALHVVGLLDVHFALQGKAVWVLEANPRASRTLPFVAKATGVDFAAQATRLMLGRTLEELGLTEDPVMKHCAVREAVFDENVQLGPVMRSTGAVMAVADSLAVAFGKSQIGAGTALPTSGEVFVSVPDGDKPAVVDLVRRLSALGFSLCCTQGTHDYLQRKGIATQAVRKVHEGSPHIADAIGAGRVAMIICAVGAEEYADGQMIRGCARSAGVPNFTTVEAARMAVAALEAMAGGVRSVVPLQAFARG